MKRKIIAMILSLCMTVSLESTITLASSGANIIVAEKQEKGTVANEQDFVIGSNGAITAYNGTNTEVVIPESINGVTVTQILSLNNQNNPQLMEKITSITIPSGVSQIENGYREGYEKTNQCWLGLSGLQNIYVNENNTTYQSKNGVLYSQNGKRLIQYPCGRTGSYEIETPVEIGEVAFYKCEGLTELTLPEGSYNIGAMAFKYCTNLEKVIVEGPETQFQEYTGTLKEQAFWGCSSLRKLELPSGLRFVEEFCFDECYNLEQITVHQDNQRYWSEDGVLFGRSIVGGEGVCLVKYPQAKQGTSYAVNEGATTIDEGAFSQCANLERITLPESMAKICEYSFDNCPKLKTVNLPERITAIGAYAFENDMELESIELPANLEYFGVKTHHRVAGYGSLNAGNVREYPDGVFDGCKNLKAVTFSSENPEFSIENGCFYRKSNGCLEWTLPNPGELVIPALVIEISDKAFDDIVSLQSLTVAEGNTSFTAEDGMLYSKDKKRLLALPGKRGTVTIPAETEQIDRKALRGEYISAFEVSPENATFFSRDGVLFFINYNNRIELKTYPRAKIGERYDIPEDVYEIGMDAFRDCTQLKTIFMPRNVEDWDTFSFDGCDELYFLIDDSSYWKYQLLNFLENKGFAYKMMTNVQNCTVELAEEGSYTGKPVELPVKVTKADEVLKNGVDYTVSYQDNTEVGTGTVTITGMGNCFGTQTKSFQIMAPSTVEFDADGGTKLSKSSINVPYNYEIGELPTVEKSGYTFLGWYTDDGTKVKPSTRIKENQTLYARWRKIKIKTYVVTFNKNGGDTISKKSQEILADQKIGTLPTAQRKGYMFKGWYTGKIDGTKVSVATVIKKNQTLYARWEKISVKATSILSAKNNKSKQAALKYRKVSGVKGYEISYTTDKKFKKAVAKKRTAKTSYTMPKLKKGKTYYVRIRAYKIDSAGKLVYSKYTKTSKVKISK